MYFWQNGACMRWVEDRFSRRICRVSGEMFRKSSKRFLTGKTMNPARKSPSNSPKIVENFIWSDSRLLFSHFLLIPLLTITGLCHILSQLKTPVTHTHTHQQLTTVISTINWTQAKKKRSKSPIITYLMIQAISIFLPPKKKKNHRVIPIQQSTITNIQKNEGKRNIVFYLLSFIKLHNTAFLCSYICALM